MSDLDPFSKIRSPVANMHSFVLGDTEQYIFTQSYDMVN